MWGAGDGLGQTEEKGWTNPALLNKSDITEEEFTLSSRSFVILRRPFYPSFAV